MVSVDCGTVEFIADIVLATNEHHCSHQEVQSIRA